MNGKKTKVLVLEGGGVFGAGIARFLSFVDYKDIRKIDCISGTSIGAILTLSYASGKSFQDVADEFEARVKECFKKRLVAKVWPLACPTYDSDALYKVIHDIIGDKTFGDIRKIFPNLTVFTNAMNVTKDKYKVFDNITGQDDDVKLADAAAYSSAAPSYFAGRDYKGDCMVDGGLEDNCSVITATTGLRGKLNIPYSDMDVLAIGTGTEVDKHPSTLERYNGYTLLKLCTELIVPYVTESNEAFTRYVVNQLGLNNFIYYNPILRGTEMDDVNEVPKIKEQCDQYKEDFKTVWNYWLNDEEKDK